MNITVGSTLT